MARFDCGIRCFCLHLTLMAMELLILLIFCSLWHISDQVKGDEVYEARYDLDGDGTIGIDDFLIFVNAFGKSD